MKITHTDTLEYPQLHYHRIINLVLPRGELEAADGPAKLPGHFSYVRLR